MTNKSKPGRLLWVDLEMTGLDPDRQRIIEVAAVVTDWELNRLIDYHAIVRQPKSVLAKMDKWCVEQHGASGLLKALPNGIAESEAEKELVGLVSQHCDTPVILAGNSVYFDRRFIRRYMPKLEALLHYRILDVSAWKVVMAGRYGIEFRKPETHRALDDIAGSIEELQYYLRLAKFESRDKKRHV